MNVTTISASSANLSAVTFQGSAGSYIANNFCRDLSIAAYGSATGAIGSSTSNTGLSLYYTSVCRLENLQITGFYNNVSYQRANNTISSHVIASFTPNTSATTAGSSGFYINGQPGVVTSGITITQNVTGNTTAAQTVTVSSTANVQTNAFAIIGSELVQITSFVAGISVTGLFRENYSSGASISFGVANDFGGNVSSVWRDCVASHASANGAYANVNSNSIGFNIFGANCADLFIDTCATSYSYYGIAINLTTAYYNSDTNEDIHVTNTTCDQFTYSGMSVTGISAGAPYDNLSVVNIVGCWALPYQSTSASSTQTAVSLSNTRGILIQGVQMLSNSVTYTPVGVLASSCSNILVRDCIGLNLTNHVQFNGTTDSSILGCRFYNQSGLASAKALWITGTSPASARIIVANNAFDGYLTVGCWIDNAGTSITFDGNTFNTANIPTPINNLVTGSASNLAMKTTNNIGYNPVGHITSPTFPASGTPYYNNFGEDLAVNIFTPASVTISAISIGGFTTSLTMAASSQLVLSLPCGQSIAFTYTGGIPQWTLLGN